MPILLVLCCGVCLCWWKGEEGVVWMRDDVVVKGREESRLKNLLLLVHRVSKCLLSRACVSRELRDV